MSSTLSKSLVALTRAEVTALAVHGRVRLNRHRVCNIKQAPGEREIFRLLALAPHTSFDSTIEPVVVELDSQWPSNSTRHNDGGSHVFWLKTEDVAVISVMTERDKQPYESLVSHTGLDISVWTHSSHWVSWTRQEVASLHLAITNDALKALGHQGISGKRLSDGYKWTEIAALLLDPSLEIKRKPKLTDALLKSADEIRFEVAEHTDTELFDVACAVEWIRRRLRKDAQKPDGIRVLLETHKENLRGQPYGTRAPASELLLKALAEHFPRAFNEELSATSIGPVLRSLENGNQSRPDWESFIECIKRCRWNGDSLPLVVLAFISGIGPQKGRQVVDALSHSTPVSPTW